MEKEQQIGFGRVGFTTILTDGDVIVIEHSGNVGTPLDLVYKNVKQYMGFDVRKNCSLLGEEGCPDYYYRAEYLMG